MNVLALVVRHPLWGRLEGSRSRRKSGRWWRREKSLDGMCVNFVTLLYTPLVDVSPPGSIYIEASIDHFARHSHRRKVRHGTP